MATVLVVGLGNPGPKYANTRHNAGWLLLDAVAGILGTAFGQSHLDGEAAKVGIGQHELVLLKPHTMMNLSGRAVALASMAFKLVPERIMVVADEVQLPVGRLKFSAGGSDGGHNGLASVIAAVGPSFARLRIGVGQGPRGQMRDWVLSPFALEEMELLASTLAHGAEVVQQWAALGGGHEAFGRVVPFANAKSKQPAAKLKPAPAKVDSESGADAAGNGVRAEVGPEVKQEEPS